MQDVVARVDDLPGDGRSHDRRARRQEARARCSSASRWSATSSASSRPRARSAATRRTMREEGRAPGTGRREGAAASRPTAGTRTHAKPDGETRASYVAGRARARRALVATTSAASPSRGPRHPRVHPSRGRRARASCSTARWPTRRTTTNSPRTLAVARPTPTRARRSSASGRARWAGHADPQAHEPHHHALDRRRRTGGQ